MSASPFAAGIQKPGSSDITNTGTHGSNGPDPRFSRQYVWYAVGLLATVNAVNYMDRMVLSVLLPQIKTDLGLSDTELGLLTGFAFAVFYAAFGIPIARRADNGVRRNIVAVALCFWSVMTALSGAAQNFLQLLLARIGVGAGEAGCIPPSQSIISDIVPLEKRAGALGIHVTGTTVGSFLGLALGGLLASQIGWRWTFVALGLPGILLALVVRKTLHEPPRGYADGVSAPSSPLAPAAALRYVTGNSTLLQLYAIFAFGSFAAFGLNQWLPSFYVRSFGLSTAEVGAFFGVAFGIGSGLGTLGGGFLVNRLAQRDQRWGVWIGAVCYALAVPFGWLMFQSETVEVALVFNFVFFVFVGIPNGPLFAMVQAVVIPRMRATSAAMNMFLASVIGIGGGPFFVGFVSDILAPEYGVESLRYALTAALFLLWWPVVHCLLAARTLRADIAKALEANG
jgi:predicted MFS family arabinose efflux permease